jgi:hypothetical protein
MTTMQIRVPAPVKHKAEEVANQLHISLSEFATRALIEKLSVAVKDPYLEARAKRGDRRKFEAVLAQVPDVPPDDYDKLE